MTATFWSIVIILCLALAVAHLVETITRQGPASADVIEATFTTNRSDG